MTKSHLLEYLHDGRRWVIEVPAVSEEDLRARIEAMRSGRYMGVQMYSIPYRWGGLARAYAWITDALRWLTLR